MYAQLGSIVFEAVGPLTDLDGRRQYGYAQHARASGKPRLQQTGDELEERRVGLAFNSAFCNPGQQLAELYALADRHEAVPLLFASGEVLGRYVVAEIEEARTVTDPRGAVTHATCRVRLLEWAGEAEDVALRFSPANPPRGLISQVIAEAKVLAESYIPPDGLPGEVPLSTITRWGG